MSSNIKIDFPFVISPFRLKPNVFIFEFVHVRIFKSLIYFSQMTLAALKMYR